MQAIAALVCSAAAAGSIRGLLPRRRAGQRPGRPRAAGSWLRPEHDQRARRGAAVAGLQGGLAEGGRGTRGASGTAGRPGERRTARRR
ncbi:MAG: hypothetical protein MZW92_30350 [Comamonadaceae bacterium]|nr:hypothetical protein [Comamonadaceae bacterium]